jgi:hypothetical protein
MNTQIQNRIKSFIWRFCGMTFVTLSTFIIQSGDIFSIDWRAFINFSVMTTLGLLVGEITKFFNNKIHLSQQIQPSIQIILFISL